MHISGLQIHSLLFTHHRALSLSLSPQKPIHKTSFFQHPYTPMTTVIRQGMILPFQEKTMKNPSNPNLGIWNSLQSLSPPSQTPKQEDTYAHHPILSEKSLELCTENLGSETGSETDFSLSSPGFSGGNGETLALGKPSCQRENECGFISQCAYKMTRTPDLSRKETEGRKVDFPPPLTTLSGSGSVRVLAHREEGRLILKAVGGPLENSTSTNFRAERSNGRLKLCFWEEDYDSDEMDFHGNQESDVCEEGDGNEEEEEDEESEDMNGNGMGVEGEMGMEKFERPRWCKVIGGCGNGSLCNWEPFWVATS